MTHDDPAEPRVERQRIQRLRALLFGIAGGEGERIQPFEPGRDEFGKLERTFLAFVEEFLAAKARAARLEAEKEALIAAQTELIDTLAAPVIEVAEGVVAIPIVGALSEARISSLTSTMLERITSMGVSMVLLDLSGADGIDTSTAGRLSDFCRAARLVGARSLITGIGPELASTLAALGVDLQAGTARTLREGIRAAIDHHTTR